MLFGSHRLKTVEWSGAEVERLYEVLLVGGKFLLAHLFYGNLYRLFRAGSLHDTLFAITEANGQLWMRLDKRLDSFGKCCCIGVLLELDAVRNIVQR